MIELALAAAAAPAEQFPAWTRRCRVHDSSYGWPPTAAQEYCHRRRHTNTGALWLAVTEARMRIIHARLLMIPAERSSSPSAGMSG